MRTLVLASLSFVVVACGAPSEPAPTPSAAPPSVVAPPPPAPPAPPPPTTTTEPGLPAPVEVCLVSDGGQMRATAYPSRAGVYDPSAPIDPAALNWSLPNRGCVTPPTASTPRVPCPDEPALPAVRATLCAQ